MLNPSTGFPRRSTGDETRARLGLGHVHPEINEANMVAAYLRAIRSDCT